LISAILVIVPSLPEHRLHLSAIIREAIMIALKTVLVPTDFSECSEAAVRYGLALAEAFGASLHLLHVVQDPYKQAWAAEGFAAPVTDMVLQWETQARERLEKTAAACAPLQTTIATRVGSPFYDIAAYASEANVDLIVIGTHGRGPIGHMLLGSVAERIVRRAPCPVLTVRHPQHEFVVEASAAAVREGATTK
jgi:nucleotide-binding universal stress UspA family protein